MNERLFSELRGVLEAQPGVLFAYVFGSQAAGEADSASDVDIAVFLDHTPSASDKMALMEAVRTPVPRRPVDLAILNAAGVTLSFEVIRGGKLLFCRDEEALNRFETRTLALYRDAAPLRRRHLEDLETKYGVPR